MSLRVASLDYLGVVAARLRKDAVMSQLKLNTIDQIIQEIKAEEQREIEETGGVDKKIKTVSIFALLCFVLLLLYFTDCSFQTRRKMEQIWIQKRNGLSFCNVSFWITWLSMAKVIRLWHMLGIFILHNGTEMLQQRRAGHQPEPNCPQTNF